MQRDIKHAINTSMDKTSCTSPYYGSWDWYVEGI